MTWNVKECRKMSIMALFVYSVLCGTHCLLLLSFRNVLMLFSSSSWTSIVVCILVSSSRNNLSVLPTLGTLSMCILNFFILSVTA